MVMGRQFAIRYLNYLRDGGEMGPEGFRRFTDSQSILREAIKNAYERD